MNLELLLEAEKRGILPPAKQELLAEARRRGLVSGGADQAPTANAPQSSRRPATRPETNMVEQSMSGFNEGVAGILGAPVDLATAAINAGTAGINRIAGTDMQPITDPVGGSGTFRNMMAPTISNTPPQTRGQRYGRRIGQEAGATAIPGGVALRGAQAPVRAAGGMTASAVGSGLAGQTSREIAPNSDVLDMAASLAGGSVVPAAMYARQPRPKAPTMSELQAARDAGYDQVHQSGARLSQKSANELADSIESTFGPRAATKRLNPKAAIASDELTADLRAAPPSIADVDETRRWIGENVAGSNEAGERRLGTMMKGRIDTHLDNLQPGDVTGTNRPEEVVQTLKAAREKANRVHKAEQFERKDTGLFDKGIRRAATTGTGGNEVNAIRQNVRRVLENPKLRRGYSEAELQAMRDIADGTPTQNALRMLSRLAPSAGALPMSGVLGGAGLAGATGNPLYLGPSIAGEVAKYAAERSTRKQIDQLGELIRNGATLPQKEMSDSTTRIVAALMAREAAQVEAGGPQYTGKTRQIIDALMARP